MNEKYHVRLAKEQFVFSSAHFITYGDDICEPLHGHNYRVAAELSGPLTENQYVVDFIVVRDELLQIVASLDHRMLLPESHPTIRVVQREGEVEVAHGSKRWVFPQDDCVILPVDNTTAEMLAREIGTRLLAALQAAAGFSPERLQVAVDECDGQWGVAIWGQ